MQDETRLHNLFTYLDGLTTLMANDFLCNIEIMECIKEIRKELAIEQSVKA